MHKLIWSLPVTLVNIIIVLINEAAVVVAVPLPSFVTSEHQNRWHCCGSSALILKRNLLNCNHISFCDNQCDLSKSGSLQPNSHKALSTGKQTIPLSNPLTSVFASKDVMKRQDERHVPFSFLNLMVTFFFFSSRYTFPLFCLMQYNSFYCSYYFNFFI